MKLTIYTDGGARGNPGPAAIGVVILKDDGSVLSEISQKIGHATNNVAEYSAVIAALQWVRDHHALLPESGSDSVFFYLDSSLVVNQLNGLFKIKNPALRELLLQIRVLEREANIVPTYTYIPREKNTRADFLVNKALDTSLS